MFRYLYEYKIPSESDVPRTFSTVADTEEHAKAIIKEKVADIEFVEEDEIEIGSLIQTVPVTGDNYYECEGCT